MAGPSPTIRFAAASSAVVALLALGGVAVAQRAPASDSTAPDGPQGDCGWVDHAAVADLPVDEAAVELSELTTFSAAIAASDLDEQLDEDGPFTVFAPSNQAIEDIPDNVFDAMIADLDLLESILGYHVHVGEALTPEELADAEAVETLTGVLRVAQEGDSFVVNDGEATVTCSGIVTANAVIYVVDRVLQPPSDSLCPGASSMPGSSAPGSVPGSSVPC